MPDSRILFSSASSICKTRHLESMAQRMNLLLLLLFCLTAIKVGGILWVRTLFVRRTHTFVGDDYPHSWPITWPKNEVLMPIHDTVRYQLDTQDGAAEWSASAPGNGIIYLGEQCRPFSISMFHQIRCLDTLRKAFVGVHPQNTSALRPEPMNWDLTRHCLNYLRQMVFCRAHPYLDPVLGYPLPNAHPDTDQCHDWNAVYQEVQRNHQRCGV
ncbi:hypothetical protein FB451DRAFT_655871 [Mycena latifolia]|nr:hypothetical protein FB451DRAFT_655871 [Mycena latifolia]